MLPLISLKSCLSPQLRRCQLLSLTFSSCYSGPAKSQLPPQTMSAGCVCKAWRERGENTPLKWVGPSHAGRLEHLRLLLTGGEQRWKTNEGWLLYFLKVLKVTCHGCGQELEHRCSLVVFWAVQWSVNPTQWKEPFKLPCIPVLVLIPARDHSAACLNVNALVSNWSIQVGRSWLMLSFTASVLLLCVCHCFSCCGHRAHACPKKNLWGVKTDIHRQVKIAAQ